MAMRFEALLEQPFATIPDLIACHARERPTHPALIQGDRQLDFAGLDGCMDRIAAALQRSGVMPGQCIAICAATSIEYASVFVGALRAGVVVAPLAPSSTADSLDLMLADCEAKLLFVDATSAEVWPARASVPRVALDGSRAGAPLEDWLGSSSAPPATVTYRPEAPFNIIYSSGTTGAPKGIVQPNRMRWAHVRRGQGSGYGPAAVTLISTPLYSNTTLVSFFPALALGGSVVLMAKFDVAKFLAEAQRHRVTHAMLVPVQYQRIMDSPLLAEADLSSFRMKFCTSAPFSAALKARILERWPGGLVEYYGMTEGGGTCVLAAHLHPNKLHTVGQPAPEHDIRVIDVRGRELAPGLVGEVVGYSPAATMLGYHQQEEKTREATWVDASGRRFIRTGDIGRFDEDGFLTLLDRVKDMIISGGFNIYPVDLENLLFEHPEVADASVVGVASEAWGETPVAYVVLKPGASIEAEALRDWLNARVGKTQRLSDLLLVSELPRNPIGKILKRVLREMYGSRAG
jgi:acyl-CoA synthetase (AMP-forming)/AMP-acid ligase II